MVFAKICNISQVSIKLHHFKFVNIEIEYIFLAKMVYLSSYTHWNIFRNQKEIGYLPWNAAEFFSFCYSLPNIRVITCLLQSWDCDLS